MKFLPLVALNTVSAEEGVFVKNLLSLSLSLFSNLPSCRRTLPKAAKFLIFFTFKKAYDCLVISIFQSIQMIRTKKEQVEADFSIHRKISCGVNFFDDSSSKPFVKRIKNRSWKPRQVTKISFSFLFLIFAQLAQSILRRCTNFQESIRKKIQFALKCTQNYTCLSLITLHEVMTV